MNIYIFTLGWTLLQLNVCVSPVWVAPLVWVAPSVCRAPSVWAPSVWVGPLWVPPLLCSDPRHVGMHRGIAHALALALAPTVGTSGRTVIINSKTTFGANRGARGAKTRKPGALPARAPRDCRGTEQWQNTSRVPAKNLPKKRLRPLWGSVTIIASGVGGMNTLYIHFFRRHEYRYSIIFSPLAE